MAELPEPALQALIGAALRGRAPQVETLLAMHPGAASRNVHAAAVLLDAEGLALLLEAGPDSAQRAGPGGATPLALVGASRMEDDQRAAAAAKVLLSAGADPNDGRALFAALEGERTSLLDALIAGGGDPTSSDNPRRVSLLHWAVDLCWKPGPVRRLLEGGANPDARWGPLDETLLHVAVRRRRLDGVRMLVEFGATVDAPTKGGDTAWRHALRRPFPEVAEFLASQGASTQLRPADELAVALLQVDLGRAAHVADAHPDLVASLNVEEARLLGDLAGQGKLAAVEFLLDRGADIEARGLDGGTPLEQCGWFAQPDVARLLIARGADIHASGCDHESTPLGWAVHGSRYSGGADGNQAAYLELVDLLLDAGATVDLPGDPPNVPGQRLYRDATETIRARLRERAFPDGVPL
ncbi:ankyrin repeat domain-containing protein [Engelhardtia mirabilis]|uniref:Ankyrin repeats (3 copies) n=1 Tax=Engelhardtia mirabilis TaxID=2528011 RepID=A0A518BMB7_9BACT|nr:Ankyrin repeats (3 copies) [Planctomycetes bacterium Pla133]QDV02447.1 Ankyrin repeats (3 copies) [Planctomycetes bacterium Pla86]